MEGLGLRFRRVVCCSALLALVVVALALPSRGQMDTSDVHQATTTPEGARFQIVQSELAAKWTFILDRFTGRVFQLVTNESGDFVWQAMEVQGRDKTIRPIHARFQIFTSGVAARFTFLVDTNTGDTWQLTSTTESRPDGSTQEDDIWVFISSVGAITP